MKSIIKWLYRKYPIIFHEILAETFLGQIPKEINDNALGVLEERKNKLIKWYMWQGFVIQRKAVNDLRKADFYLGMLTQIKIELSLLGATEVKDEKDISTKTIKEIKKDNVLDAQKGVKDFINKSKKVTVDK